MQIVFRVAAIYISLFVGLRLMGKREFGQLSPMELITLLVIPEIVSPALTDDDHSITGAVVGVATLLALVFVTSAALHLFKPVETLLGGKPCVLVEHGTIITEAMNVERVTPDELMNEIHKAGLDELSQVKWAILESDGKVSIIAEESEEPATTPSQDRVLA